MDKMQSVDLENTSFDSQEQSKILHLLATSVHSVSDVRNISQIIFFNDALQMQ